MTADRFKEPDGFQWGTFKNAQGADIRYARVKTQQPARGTVVILQGFRESIEKYHEVTRDMLARGFDVCLMDWRGQGGSQRYLPNYPQKAHHEGYDEQIETLHHFMQQVVAADAVQPLIMLGHSMGAHLGLRYLKEHPGVFDSAVLSSPMLDINTGSMPRSLARQVAKFAKAGRYMEKYVPGGCDWSEEKQPFENNLLTSDPDRFEMEKQVCRDNETLKTGDPTYGWVYHSFESIDKLSDEEYLKAIETPVLMQVSDNDHIVDRAAQDRAAGLLPNCTMLETKGARHEIWMEADAFRQPWLAAVDTFIDERAKPAGPAPKKPKPHSPRPPGM